MGEQHLAPCGLDCATCPFYLATQQNSEANLDQLYTVSARLYPAVAHKSVEDMRCDSCSSEHRSFLCRNCAIRDCADERHYAGCHVCEEFPCLTVKTVPNATRRQAILQAITKRVDQVAETKPVPMQKLIAKTETK